MVLFILSSWLPCFILLSFLSIIFHTLTSSKFKKPNLPPGPPTLPIVGNLHQLGHLVHKSLHQLSKKYGPIMLLHLGRVPTLIISSAEMAKEVLKIHDHECCNRPLLVGPKRLSYNFLDVSFAPYGGYWRDMRKIFVLELLSLKKVQSFGFVRSEEVSSMINSISESSNYPVNLSEKVLSLTYKITCRVAFGKDYETRGFDNGRLKQVIHEALAVLSSFSAGDFFPYFGWIIDVFTGFNARIEKCFHELESFSEMVINEHLDKERPRQDEEDIVDILIRLQREETGAVRLTRDHIKAILVNIFLAGVDTSAITIVWAMTELMRNPRVIKKVQEEIRICVKNKGKVEESDLEQLEYLKMVVKETLRLYPPGPLLIPRETTSHFKINGYDIYPKTRIQVNAWAIGRDPESWNNAEEFFPERFEDGSFDFKGNNFEFLPFGAGRRGCPGINMGILTVELTLANLLYCFNWELPNGMKKEDINIDVAPSLALQKKSALCLVPFNYI